MGNHTIILFQSAGLTTRTYYDHESIGLAMDKVVELFEHQLKEMNPGQTHITYDVQHLMRFIDDVGDICALVLDPNTQKYSPYGRDWIKQQVFLHLKKQAGRRS